MVLFAKRRARRGLAIAGCVVGLAALTAACNGEPREHTRSVTIKVTDAQGGPLRPYAFDLRPGRLTGNDPWETQVDTVEEGLFGSKFISSIYTGKPVLTKVNTVDGCYAIDGLQVANDYMVWVRTEDGSVSKASFKTAAGKRDNLAVTVEVAADGTLEIVEVVTYRGEFSPYDYPVSE